ncbi:helix-turn-helix domain-containing protein [Brevibacillus sp. H7]|uniref:helix-turn-helix domain-containing protein n=1 Tax=Brevibacillus sp. H7 TaxID=3349138 RepID=UPI00382D91B4
MDNRNLTLLEKEFLYAVTLNGLAPLAGERTLQSLYYIFRGRKANQTLQDVHLYSLHPYYRMFPRISREAWEENIAFLLSDGLVRLTKGTGGSPKPSFALTEQGVAEQQAGRERFRLDYWFTPFSSPTQPEQVSLFWQRLHLMIQTVSQLLANDTGFQPVVQNRQVQQWVKRTLASVEQRLLWQDHLYNELFSLLSALPLNVQELIVRQLSGASQVGSTVTQLALSAGQSPSFIQLQVRFGLAVIVRRLEKEKDAFPLLSTLIEPTGGKDLRLSESASQTYELVRQHCTLDEIARRRNIKSSTVEDHLVEIALHCPEWDCVEYVSEKEQEEIIRVSERLGTSRLRLLKDSLGPQYSYLKIRLALALRKGREHGA